eukprot:TRINITY_DN35399_c0_g1_i1.p1 TRINITY_DN35399_c0_g1~~TRINITY_DN35399_c0_g1_i1.p1  ORF type:complete len:164 (+),score=22.28 TRINITY_DN35399_c0_g1_i1:128-619(+)
MSSEERKQLAEARAEAAKLRDDINTALGAISKRDVAELQAMPKPPKILLEIFEMAFLLMGRDAPKWPIPLNNFLNDIKGATDSQIDNLKTKHINQVRRMLESKLIEQYLTEVTLVSRAGVQIMNWIDRVICYHELKRLTAPLAAKIRKLDEEQATGPQIEEVD